MKALKQLSDGFANIPSRQRLTAIVAVTVVLALGGNLLLLKPQRVMLTSIELRTKANQTSMEASVRALAELDSDVSKGVDKFAGEQFAAKRSKPDPGIAEDCPAQRFLRPSLSPAATKAKGEGR